MCSTLLVCICLNSCKHTCEQQPYVQRCVCTYTWTHGRTDTQTHRHTDTWTYGHTDTRTQGHRDTGTKGHRDKRTPGHRDTRPAAGRPLSRVLQAATQRSSGGFRGSARCRIFLFSPHQRHFGLQTPEFQVKKGLCFYGQHQVKLLCGR